MMSVSLSNISKRFDDNLVLEDFSLFINNNENIAIMGESGRGKTTLLNIIAGIIKPDSGSLSGADNKKIAYVFQEDRLAENFTVYRNIKLACDNSVNKKTVAEALEAIGLDKKLVSAKVCTLSGGMKRRVAILRAILSKSDLILLDEPTKGLDEQNKNTVIEYILHNTADIPVIWVTHDEKEAQLVSERVIWLR